ncbi:hypothetical protein POM88_005774 [Heracleum sosnowskyi]|uniref:Uncharacterized protein n=1 Tax=Heracleum sosnowskyi TaxID=360622 RepID=A0AAD8N4R1_9APIA|nr:hypothetical protein POM88_005774 [Heracleum sosnowskyi]
MEHDVGKSKQKKDEVEVLQEKAHDLIETKMLFDIDLKLALQKDSQNKQLLTIRDIINDVFHPIKQDEPVMEINQKSNQISDGIPSSSLGIDEDIYAQDEAENDNDKFVTPQPAMREKNT